MDRHFPLLSWADFTAAVGLFTAHHDLDTTCSSLMISNTSKTEEIRGDDLMQLRKIMLAVCTALKVNTGYFEEFKMWNLFHK